ncbi:GNAT family N-acetyltransferase [Tateyamaria sp. SN6-1]|uniref:GNAT family N-acetyltransferase n=1 Tax=Tateyamaria sp. SN6-1 TaxID=3092148 RepID=UPI0039F5C2B9
MTYSVRAAVPGDAQALRALHTASWRASYGPFVPADALGAPLDATMQARWGTWPADRLIRVAERDGAMLGFGAVERGAVPLLDNLHVHPDARSGGVGASLLRAICAALAKEGAEALRLIVIAANPRARAFYRKLGGVEAAPVDDTLLGHPVRMVPVRFSGGDFTALSQEL